jgi:hypothetical protein
MVRTRPFRATRYPDRSPKHSQEREHMRTRIAVVASVAIAVALPATAGAATKTVDAGTPRSDQRSFRPL